MGDKGFQLRLPPSLESFYPHDAQVSIYRNQCVVDSLYRPWMRMYFESKTTSTLAIRRLFHHRHPNEEATRICTRSYGYDDRNGHLFVMPNNACHPPKLLITSIDEYIKYHCICVNLRHLGVIDILLRVFICTQISIKFDAKISHLIRSVNCDVTCPLWRHKIVVSCLVWDQSIPDTRSLSHM